MQIASRPPTFPQRFQIGASVDVLVIFASLVFRSIDKFTGQSTGKSVMGCYTSNVNLQRPLRILTPTLDGDVLSVLASGDVKLTGRDIGRKIAASQEGARLALERLVAQGIVLQESAGNAHLYQLNREHLAAPLIERLASLRLDFIDRLRKVISGWSVPPVAAILFGSVARNDSDENSDIDIMVIRPERIGAETPAWQTQIAALQSCATRMTGNDCRVFEVRGPTARQLREADGVIKRAAKEGIELFGSVRGLVSPKRKRTRNR
jgi:hypothetical protein